MTMVVNSVWLLFAKLAYVVSPLLATALTSRSCYYCQGSQRNLPNSSMYWTRSSICEPISISCLPYELSCFYGEFTHPAFSVLISGCYPSSGDFHATSTTRHCYNYDNEDLESDGGGNHFKVPPMLSQSTTRFCLCYADHCNNRRFNQQATSSNFSEQSPAERDLNGTPVDGQPLVGQNNSKTDVNLAAPVCRLANWTAVTLALSILLKNCRG